MNPRRDPLPPHFEQFLRRFQELTSRGRLVVLSGAGVSAASGLPTFRGPEGWWTVGSAVYTPQDLATRSFFTGHPELVWSWYLFRRSRCRTAQPNAAHEALAQLARRLGDRLSLVTQNVDGLHRRAGSPAQSTFEIHGNLEYMRCAAPCSRQLCAVPEDLHPWSRNTSLDADAAARLRCPACRQWMRPHVLWFDEYYEEEYFHCDSSLAAVEAADALLVVGCSGATTLPMLLLQRALQRNLPVLVVDPNDTPFADAAGPRNTLRLRCCDVLPQLVEGPPDVSTGPVA